MRHLIPLGKQYIDDFLQLDINGSVAEAGDGGAVPLLIVHGRKDLAVPFSEGEKVFAAAAEPKEFLDLPQANHLISSTKDIKKVLNAVLTFIQKE